MKDSDPSPPASPVLSYAAPGPWRPQSPAWLLFCVLPTLLLLAAVSQAEYFNYVTCWALPLRQDLSPHARWHDFRDEADWRINLLSGPNAETRPLTPAEFAQMTYEVKRGPMGGELGNAVTASILALCVDVLVGLPSALLLLWLMHSRWRRITWLCLGGFVACGAIIYHHGYFGAFID